MIANMFLESKFKIDNEIYFIEIESIEDSVPFEVETTDRKGMLKVTFFVSVEYMPGQWDEEEDEHFAFVDENFNSKDYVLCYPRQQEDKFLIIAIPKSKWTIQ